MNLDELMRKWLEMQQLLSGRGRAIPLAGKMLSSMVAAYGVQFVKKCCQMGNAPSWRRAQALMEVYEWLGDYTLTDDQAAALDSVFGRNLTRDQRAKVVEWVKEGKSAQDIDDLLELIPSSSPSPAVPTVTEDDVRKWFAQTLGASGWDVRMEQPTAANVTSLIRELHPEIAPKNTKADTTERIITIVVEDMEKAVESINSNMSLAEMKRLAELLAGMIAWREKMDAKRAARSTQ